ncbi:MAG: lysylphosphatidylglycerol synthase transmembrane domain-containing protein [Bacteroidia bacterium]
MQFVFLLLLGIGLIWYTLSKITFADLLGQLKTGHYWIAFPIGLISIAGYYFRSARMKILLRKMGESCRIQSLMASLCMGYTISFAIPRLGDLTRALTVRKTDGVKVDFALISIITERFFDMLVLILLVLVSLFIHGTMLVNLWKQNNLSPLFSASTSRILWMMGIVVLLLFISLLLLRKNDWLRMLWNRYQPAFRGVLTVVGSGRFWLFTFGIWTCYFLMTYLWFYLFDEIKHLTVMDAFLVMLAGTFGRSIPVQGGGMGVYHVLVSSVLVMLGINLVTGNALAFVIHGAQAIITFLAGLWAYIWMLTDLRKTVKPAPEQN